MAQEDLMKFDTENAGNVAKSINSRANQLTQTMNKVKKSIEEVTVWWEGTSGEKFAGQYQRIEKRVNKLIECVTTISEQVVATAQAKEKEEEQISAQLDQSFIE